MRGERRGVRTLAGLLAYSAGCGGDLNRPSAAPVAEAPPASVHGAVDAAIDADSDIALVLTIEALTARGSWLAPGMTEIARLEANDRFVRRDIVRAPDRDVCTRVAFAAGTAVHAWLEDAAGAQLSDAGRAASGALGARGPVCVRRGDAIVLRIDSDRPTTIHVVAWSAP